MLVLRCTQKLLKRVGPPVADPPASTTALGDWYSQPLAVGHRRFVLLASERSRLPILMPGRDVKHFAKRFPAALERVLARLGVPAAIIRRELAEMDEIIITRARLPRRGHAAAARVRGASFSRLRSPVTSPLCLDTLIPLTRPWKWRSHFAGTCRVGASLQIWRHGFTKLTPL